MDSEVEAHVAAVAPSARRRDAETLVDLMQRVTGEQPRMWGTIVGFGSHHYRYDTGREGDTPAVGFAARKAASTIYLVDGVAHHAELLADLGPHSVGKGCLYVKDLARVDLGVLEAVIRRSYASVTSGR